MSAGRFGMGRAGIENGQAGRAADDINAADSRPGRPAAKGIKLRMPAPDAQMPGPQPPAKVNRRCRAHLRGGKTGGFGLPRVGPGVASPFHKHETLFSFRIVGRSRRRAKVVARRGKGTLDAQLPLGHRQVVQESTAGGQLGTPHRYLSARYGCLTHERCLGWKFAIESIPGGHPFHQPALPKCGAIVAAASSSRHDGQAPVLAGDWGTLYRTGQQDCGTNAIAWPRLGHNGTYIVVSPRLSSLADGDDVESICMFLCLVVEGVADPGLSSQTGGSHPVCPVGSDAPSANGGPQPSGWRTGDVAQRATARRQ
ncbi:hypothetical protein ACCO45_004834 [Purpureocillium lilacinum]|uniref:Uncharacterized protein n=1 Tax=Purpureocillium lilacinum TaxID=33203 RepID=A0ACC4DUV9_PURLI